MKKTKEVLACGKASQLKRENNLKQLHHRFYSSYLLVINRVHYSSTLPTTSHWSWYCFSPNAWAGRVLAP